MASNQFLKYIRFYLLKEQYSNWNYFSLFRYKDIEVRSPHSSGPNEVNDI